MDSSNIRKALEASEFFGGLDPRQIDSLIPLCREFRYAAGEAVYAQGGTGDSIYIVADGQVDLERAVNLGARQGRLAVAMLGPGKVFGGWSTLLAEPHRLMLSAVCRKASRLILIEGVALRALMTADIRLGFVILEKLCFLLRERILSTLGAVENI